MPCQVCRHILQNGKLHSLQTAKSDWGSDTTRAPHILRGQNTIPGMESKWTSSLKWTYLNGKTVQVMDG